MQRTLMVTILLVAGSTASAYEGTPSEQVNAFFGVLATGETGKAVDELYSSNAAFQQKAQALTVLKQQLASIPTLYGDYLGVEKVREESISPSVTRIVAIEKHSVHPIVWEFYFYKPGDKWLLSQAVFADQFQFLESKK